MRALALVVLVACVPTTATTPLGNQAAQADPIALSVVFNMQEIWIGNDDFETDPAARYPGALHALERGLDAISLPSGTIAVFGYATGTEAIVSRRPLQRIGHELGDQHRYRNKIGTDMVMGITAAVDDLEKAHAAQKVLVIVGDGNDTNNDYAAPKLVELAKRVTTDRIEVRALVWKSVVSAEGEVIRKLTSNVTVIADPAELERRLPAAATP